MKYEFTKDCEIGIESIDNEHKQFFEYINAGLEALNEPEDLGGSMAKGLLAKLTDYAITHLNHEEDYMKDTKDAELFIQIRAHQLFRDKINEFKAKENLSKDDLKDIFAFMAKWLYNHILTTDTLIGKEKIEGRFTMTKDFLTGIEIVDQEHKTLFDIIGRVYDIISNEFLYDKYDPIMEVLGELKDYTIMHFSDEEEYMTRIGYEGLPSQKAAHDAFVEKLGEVGVLDESDIDNDQAGYLEGLVNFLNEWLINHILKMDKKIPNKEVQ